MQSYKQALGDKFELITAFSREGSKKVYVQHRLREQAAEVNALLEKKAYFYVCGDAANMAREVNTFLGQIIAEQRGVPEAKGEEIVKNMRAANQYQVGLFAISPSKKMMELTQFTGGCLVVIEPPWPCSPGGDMERHENDSRMSRAVHHDHPKSWQHLSRATESLHSKRRRSCLWGGS